MRSCEDFWWVHSGAPETAPDTCILPARPATPAFIMSLHLYTHVRTLTPKPIKAHGSAGHPTLATEHQTILPLSNKWVD